MNNEKEIKKLYLVDMFNSVSGMGLIEEEHEQILWFEMRGYTTNEAKQELLNKCRRILLRNDDITDIIVRSKDIPVISINEAGNPISIDKDDEDYARKWREEYIDYLAMQFRHYDFKVVNGEPVEGKDVLDEIREVYTACEMAQHLIEKREYRESQLRQYENLISTPVTKAQQLGRDITPYGFFDLPKTRTIVSDDSKIKLLELIANKGIPYAVAMFDYLGFIRHLTDNYPEFKTQEKLCKEISKWLWSDLTGRTVKGNILTLNERTDENKERYTAHKHKETVVKDYEALK